MARSILVADFDLTRRLVLTRVLRAEGHEVVEAGDAEAAEAALAERHFALVFVAMRLSGGDGFELCRAWSARGLRVVLMSTEFRASEPLRRRGRDAGAVALLSSAADCQQILDVTHHLFESPHPAS